jgi:hypothetical protein
MTPMNTKTGELRDVSKTGALLSTELQLNLGDYVMVRVGAVERFANVVRVEGELFGVQFEEPLSGLEMRNFQHEASTTALMRLTPAQRQAWEDWRTGRG